MALHKLNIQTGINNQQTQTLNTTSWWACNLIRFRDGTVEKIGGWQKLFTQAIAGLARAMHAFEDLTTATNLLIGGDGGLEVFSEGALNTIFLADFQTNPALGSATATITPAMGSTLVTVVDTNYNPATGTRIYLPMTMSIGGRRIDPALYTVTNVNATTYTFNTPLVALSNAAAAVPVFSITAPDVGTTTVRVTLAAHGLVIGDPFIVQFTTTLGASGVTMFGSYTVVSVPNASTITLNSGQISTTTNGAGTSEGDGNVLGSPYIWYLAAQPTTPQNWYLDNFGNDATISYTNSSIYTWTPPVVSGSNVAILLDGAPTINTGTFVAMPQAQIVAMGSEVILGGGVQDPLLLRWCDAGDDNEWTADATNQAGSFRLSKGSRIVGGTQLALTTLIWTDTDIWTMAYTGPPLVYSFNILASGCGLISPKAFAIIGGTCYWMGDKQFYSVGAGGGGVQSIYCPVWDIIFNDLDTDNLNKINMGANSAFDEVFIFYPSASGGTGEVDKYVLIHRQPGGGLKWSYGNLGRTTWIDQSVFGEPMGADLNLHIQQHEIGYDDDDVAMAGVFIESGYADTANGDAIMTTDEFIPDLKWFGEVPGAINLTLKGVKYPQGPIKVKGPYGMDMSNRHIRPRMRARSIAIRLDWIARLGYNARVGAMRIRTAFSGRRP